MKTKVLMFFLLFAFVFNCEKKNYSVQKIPSWDEIYNKTTTIAKGWKFIVLHHSATRWGSAKAFHKYHTQKGYGGLAYHFVIGNGRGSPNGKVEAGFRWKKQMIGTHVTVNAWYHNIFGIGICLVGNFDRTRPTKRQLKSLIKLLRKLVKKYKIPRKNILGHGQVPHGDVDWNTSRIIVNYIPGARERKTCPGRYFPMKYVLNKVYQPS